MIQYQTKRYEELVKSLRDRQTANQLGYRFAVAARGALRRLEKALTLYIKHANDVLQDDERIIRELEQDKANDTGTTSPPPPPPPLPGRTAMRPPPMALPARPSRPPRRTR